MNGTYAAVFNENAPLAAWTVVCLRPAAQQAAVKRKVLRAGGAFVALPGVRLAAMAMETAELRHVLGSEAVIFTSPAAVAFASKQLPLREHVPQFVFAVGEGTARVLRRAGVAAITPNPSEMRSEGVLALPQWCEIKARTGQASVGIITAPGGRDALATALRERGFAVRIAQVYQRLPPRWHPRTLKALAQSQPPRAVLVSSGEALMNLLEKLAPEDAAMLRNSVAVVSSERLFDIATREGFTHVLRADSPVPNAMLQTLIAWRAGMPIHRDKP